MNDPAENSKWTRRPPDPDFEKKTAEEAFAHIKKPQEAKAAGVEFRKIAAISQQEKEGPSNEVSKAYYEMISLIHTCPDEHLIELFKEKTGSHFIPNFAAIEASEHLTHLEQMATFGSKEAFACLASVATRIVEFLDEAAGNSNDEIQTNVEEGSFTHRESESDENLTMDEAKINTNIDILLKSPKNIIDNLIDIASDEFPGPYTNHSGLNLFSEIIRRQTQGNAIRANPLRKSMRTEYESPVSSSVEFLLSILLSYRTQHLAREAIRQVIAEANVWPAIAPALKDDRGSKMEQHLCEIGLGSDLVYNLGGLGPGRKRQLDPHTSTGRTFEVFQRLDRVRRDSQKMMKEHREEYEYYEEHGAIRPSLDRMNQDETSRKLDALREWNSTTHWLRKATLLPQPLKKNIKAWADAAVSYELSKVAIKIYSNEEGRRIHLLRNKISYNSPTLDCEPDPRRTGAPKRSKQIEDKSSEEIRSNNQEEVELYQSLEKKVRIEFASRDLRKEIIGGLNVILG